MGQTSQGAERWENKQGIMFSTWLFPQRSCVSNTKNRAVKWLQHMKNYGNYYKKRLQLVRTSVFSFFPFFLSYDVRLVRPEQAKRGGSWVFKVTASRHPSATLWGWTPDSKGEPCSSISTLLHFLSLKLHVPKGAWESILISGGWGAFLLACSASNHCHEGDLFMPIYLF